MEDFIEDKMAEREGFEPSDQLPSRILSKDVHSATLPSLQEKRSGGTGIRTPGEFPHDGFQDRRLKPLGHSSTIPTFLGPGLCI